MFHEVKMCLFANMFANVFACSSMILIDTALTFSVFCKYRKIPITRTHPPFPDYSTETSSITNMNSSNITHVTAHKKSRGGEGGGEEGAKRVERRLKKKYRPLSKN